VTPATPAAAPGPGKAEPSPPPTEREDAEADATAAPTESPIDEDRLMAHSYDGIREYDNPLPGWWRAIFWGSIVFAAGYWIWFQVGKWGQTPDQKYRAELADYQSKKAAREAAEAASVSEDKLATDAENGGVLAHGAEIFAAKCVSCHQADGRGLIGPNLTDLYQIHGSTRMDIFTTIKNGVPGTAMPPWGEQLSAADVVDVAAYVITLRGKDVPGKEPQGAPVERFGAP